MISDSLLSAIKAIENELLKEYKSMVNLNIQSSQGGKQVSVTVSGPNGHITMQHIAPADSTSA